MVDRWNHSGCFTLHSFKFLIFEEKLLTFLRQGIVKTPFKWILIVYMCAGCSSHPATVSVTVMLNDLKWPTLQRHRKYLRLILLFKVVNHLQLIPEQYLPSPTRLTSTRSNHLCKFYHIQTSCDTYKFYFIPKTIPEWNSLQINNINILSLADFKLALTNN